MLNYAYRGLPWDIVFGVDAARRLPDEMDQRGLERALVLTTPNQARQGEQVMRQLAHRAVGLFSEAVMHVPSGTLAAATHMAKAVDARCTVALGGGSTTGLGKALAVKNGLANVAIPTTYAGSEMTDIWAVTEGDRKVTKRDVRAVPTLTIYDPKLTLSLPPKFAAASGMNAMAQAVVNVATHRPNPMVGAMAADAIRTLAQNLPLIMRNGDDLEARTGALYGASLAAAALGTGTTSLHHRLCHTFGGAFNTPHAETHAVLLPYSVDFNASAIPKATSRVAEALGSDSAAGGLRLLAESVGAPLSLSEIGVGRSDIEKAVRLALAAPLDNARPVSPDELHELLVRAFDGQLLGSGSAIATGARTSQPA